MAIDFPRVPNPGGATSPTLDPWHMQFLSAESESTATLMGFYQQARMELETFIRTGDLTASDSVFYRDLLDETNRIGTVLNKQAATWVSSTIPEAYSSGRRLTSSVVIPEKALRALSADPLALLKDTTDMMRRSVRGAVASGILESLSGADLRARILSTGLTNIPKWPSVEYRAGVIARTETMKAFNAGAIEGYRDNGARFVRWIASPDEATCSICMPRDGDVFRLSFPDVDEDVEVYPNAQILDPPPVHPRCRCTVRAEYRGPDGEVMRSKPPAPPPIEVEPKISQGDMGYDKEPELPPATGDFQKAVGRLKDKRLIAALEDSAMLKPIVNGPFSTPEALARFTAAEKYLATERAFWRNLPRLTDDQIRIIAGMKGNAVMDGYLISRWGSRFVGTGWNADAKFYTIRALERIHGLNPAYLKDSPFLQFIGKAPPGSRVGGNAIAAAWSSGYIGVSMTKWSKYLAGQTLRAGPGVNAGEEVILHEFMHALHSEFGMSAQLRYFGPNKGTTQWPAIRTSAGGLQEGTFESAWKSITTRREIAPDVSKIDFYEQQIRSFEASRQRALSEGQRTVVYDELIEKYNLKIYEIREALKGHAVGSDYFPTSYAMTGGYAEDFAESAMLYFLNPEALKAYAPGRYEFIQREIWNGVEP